MQKIKVTGVYCLLLFHKPMSRRGGVFPSYSSTVHMHVFSRGLTDGDVLLVGSRSVARFFAVERLAKGTNNVVIVQVEFTTCLLPWMDSWFDVR